MQAEATLEQRAQSISTLEKSLDAAGRLVRAAEKSGDIAAAAATATAKADTKAEEKKEEPKAPEAPTQHSS